MIGNTLRRHAKSIGVVLLLAGVSAPIVGLLELAMASGVVCSIGLCDPEQKGEVRW